MPLDYSFSTQDLDAMRETQEAHMMDAGNVQKTSVAFDSFGEGIETPTDQEPIRCGLDMRPGSERHGLQNTVVEFDATVRLPLGTAVVPQDYFRVTKRFGEDLAEPLVFRVVSPVQQGPSGIRLLLRRIET